MAGQLGQPGRCRLTDVGVWSPVTQASGSSRPSRPFDKAKLSVTFSDISLFLIKVNQQRQICFHLAEEKSKMRNRGKRGGRRVGCIVCGRLTVQSYWC